MAEEEKNGNGNGKDGNGKNGKNGNGKDGNGTGIYDAKMLQSLRAIQESISDLKGLLKKHEEKPYEESRKSLRDRIPKLPKPVMPKLPDVSRAVPSTSAVADFAVQAAKMALAATFLAGLLEETLVKWFKEQKFDPNTLGGVIGGALRDLLTEQPGEAPLRKRFAEAFKFGIKTAAYGAAAGFVVGGPIGAVAGAIMGLAGGMLYDFLRTDTGEDAQALYQSLKDRFKNAAAWATVGAVAGLALALTLGPVGLLAGVLMGAAAGAIYGFLKDPRPTQKEKMDKMLDDIMEEDIQKPMKTWIERQFSAIGEWFRKDKLKKVMEETGKSEEEVLAMEEFKHLRPGVEDTQDIYETQMKADLSKKALYSMRGIRDQANLKDSFREDQKERLKRFEAGKSEVYKPHGFVEYTLPDNTLFMDSELKHFLRSKTMLKNGSVPNIVPGEVLLVPQQFAKVLQAATQHADLEKKLYFLQKEHMEKSGGDAPDLLDNLTVDEQRLILADPADQAAVINALNNRVDKLVLNEDLVTSKSADGVKVINMNDNTNTTTAVSGGTNNKDVMSELFPNISSEVIKKNDNQMNYFLNGLGAAPG